MKKVFQCVLVAVCLFVVGNVRVMAEDAKEDVKIDIPLITGKPFNGNDFRNGGIIPFIAHYQGGTIYISTPAEFSSITVDVVNETTGQEWNSTTDISDGMGEICITSGGVGSYSVEIETEYGDCFVGRFILN